MHCFLNVLLDSYGYYLATDAENNDNITKCSHAESKNVCVTSVCADLTVVTQEFSDTNCDSP